MAMSEVGNNITVRLNTATTTAATWRAWGKDQNRFVVLSDGDVNDLDAVTNVMTAEAPGTSTAAVLGLLTQVGGSDTSLTGTVLLMAADVTVKGPTGTNAIADADRDPGRGFKFNASSEVIVNGSAGGVGQVLGGTQGSIRVSFMSQLYRQ